MTDDDIRPSPPVVKETPDAAPTVEAEVVYDDDIPRRSCKRHEDCDAADLGASLINAQAPHEPFDDELEPEPEPEESDDTTAPRLRLVRSPKIDVKRIVVPPTTEAPTPAPAPLLPHAESRKMLRDLAKNLYAINPDWTIQELWNNDPRMRRVSAETLRRWSVQENWDGYRAELDAKTVARMKKRFGDVLFHERAAEFEKLRKQKKRIDEHIENEVVKPKSYEQMVRLSMELGKRIEELMSSSGKQVLDGAADPLAGIELTDEQKLKVTKFLVELKRSENAELKQKTPKQLSPPAKWDDDDD